MAMNGSWKWLPLLLVAATACTSARPPAPVASVAARMAEADTGAVASPAAAISADDIGAARRALESARAAALADGTAAPAARIRYLMGLGLWAEAEAVLAGATRSADVEAAAAMLRMRQHRYAAAEAAVARALAADPDHRRARLLRARLRIQAWELDAAAAAAQALLDEDPRDEEAALLLGRIRLLEKDYTGALAWAERVQRWNPRSAGAYLLEADVRFWAQDPAGAEAPLARALELDPFDADARFAYGYAIWRRVDATQLDDMAAQWDLALEVDPLHYLTHWHWGNGHTHLTYADYAQPTDSIVRARLVPARERLARDDLSGAIARTRAVEREFPESVLPAMLRGSVFYMAWEMDRAARLDSAQATFRAILARKPHYGPAHNGLAAVIKQRQFAYLSAYDSLEAAIAASLRPEDPIFEAVFDDIGAYPGDRVERMVRHQLGPAIAYLPLLHRLGRDFTIPPLHVDLAEAMDRPGLRTSTTFDNRQWMDIRGIGGGATGIEYVERGAHWERNVVAHEYTHLFHGSVLTDAERRRVRALYYAAMAEDRTLDYYASNNESEFLAQAYEAYLSPVKAHPLTHKAMNTRADLARKDPATYAFIDSLVARLDAALAGDARALASNWAEVYVGLAARERGGGGGRGRDEGGADDGAADDAGRWRAAAALLDSALVWDADYLPAYLGYAALYRERRRFDEAARWLAKAASIDPDYAPIYSARAELVAARAAAGELEPERALDQQVALYRESLALERDLSVRAELNEALRTLYAAHARIPDAIRVAEAYVAKAPTVSTYLRDRRDEAAAFAAELRAATGYAAETLPFFTELVGQKPQHYDLRMQYADALAAAGRYEDAIATLEGAQRILRAAGRPRGDYTVRLAELELLHGDAAAARRALHPVLAGRIDVPEADPTLLRVLAALVSAAQAAARESDRDTTMLPAHRAEHAFTHGWIAEFGGATADAERAYREALAADPYHRRARLRLAALLARDGRPETAQQILAEADSLPLPLGPDFQREAAAIIRPAR